MIPGHQTRRVKALLNIVLRLAVSLVLLWFPLRHVAIGTVFGQIALVDRQAILAALMAIIASTVVAAIRWTLILSALNAPRNMRVTYPLSLIGVFFGQALPAGVGGDVVRVWLACKTGLTTRIAVSSVLADRLTGLLAILIIVTAELPALGTLVHNSTIILALIVILAIGYIGLMILMVLDKLSTTFGHLRVVRGLAAISADLRAVVLTPRVCLPVLLCGAAVQVLNVLAVFALAQGLHLPADLGKCFLIVPFANVLQTVPISIAGWGIRESFFVLSFGLIGVSAPSALAVSVVFGALIIVASLPGGILWLLRGTGSPLKAREIIGSAVPSE